VKAPVSGDVPVIPDSTALVTQLVRILEVGQGLRNPQMSELTIQRLVCCIFAIFLEGSLRDPSFWDATKHQAKFDRLLFSLLIEESHQPIRKGISDIIFLICSPSKQFKKPKFPAPQAQEAREVALSENPTRIDILATIWDAFVRTFSRVLEFPTQSQEFFEAAYIVFTSVAEKSPHDLIFSEYLRQWSGIMLSHRTNEVCCMIVVFQDILR
jgi:ubiquitin carboxyl-terminal hydrolase 34